MADSALTKKYAKWEHIDEEDAGAAAVTAPARDAPKTGTGLQGVLRFDNGEGSFVPTSDWYLDGVDIPAMKIIKSAEKEVWQVVVRKLRVWCHTTTPVFPDTPVDDAACRPWCILVFNLYPAGRILTHQWCNPPDVFPTGAAVMPILLSLMRDPPDSVPQRRPKSIVFADTVLASQCFNSLMALGVECSQLFETPGTSGIVRELSRIMIDKDVATGGGAASSLPGLLESPGVTVDLLSNLYTSASAFYTAKPWRNIAERQAFQITVDTPTAITPSIVVPAGTCWAVILGNPGSSVTGVCLFWSRWDAEQRLLSDAETGVGKLLKAAANPYTTACAACGAKQALGGPELKRCSRCKGPSYCGADCQKAHWASHKPSCKAVPALVPGERYWGEAEGTCMFDTCTAIPFDDHDAIEANGFPIAAYNAYPLPLVLRRGVASRPSAVELVWLIRALNIIPLFIAAHKSVARTVAPVPDAFVVDYKAGGVSVPDWDVGVARVLPDPILRPEEMAVVVSMIREGTVGRLERVSDDEGEEAKEEPAAE